MYYGYGYANSMASTMTGITVWEIIALVLSIVGAILVYVLFLTKKNEGKFKGFWAWLYSALKFDKMMIEVILKVLYIFSALFVTLGSFGLIPISFLSFLLVLVVGNLITRIMYELFLVVLIICRNTTDISKKLDKKELVDKKEENQ